MTTPVWTFYTVFKNVPYTDEEWDRLNQHQTERLHRQAFKTRPMHSFKRGPTAHSHEEARRICELALKNGAQMVSYSVWSKNRHEEEWTLRKKGQWYRSWSQVA